MTMSSTVLQIVSAVAGLALLTTGLVVFPRGQRHLAKGIAVAVSLAVLAAVLIGAVRNFGP